MPVRDILLLGHPLLWQPAAPVIAFGSPKVAEVIADLGATLADFRLRHHFGRAIAAPQIGNLERIIFVDVGEARPLINPQIVERSDEIMELWDDCFSFPDLMVRVRRHYRVTVNYSDEHGNARRWEVEGSLSELLQHEIDHLDGILATDRAIDTRSFAMRSEVERRSEN
jgi:peptide deformylase